MAIKKFSKFINENLPIRIKSSKEPMFVMIVGEDESCIKEWYERNLNGMKFTESSFTDKGGDSLSNQDVSNGLLAEQKKLEASFRTGNTVIHLAKGADKASIERSMRVAKAQGLTTALVTFDDVKCDQNLVDVKYKL
jgi:hypothetical protein